MVFGIVGQGQRAGGGDDGLLVHGDAGQGGGFGAGGDDDVLRLVDLVADLDLAGGGDACAQPLSQVTLFFLNRNSMPLVFWPTTSSL